MGLPQLPDCGLEQSKCWHMCYELAPTKLFLRVAKHIKDVWLARLHSVLSLYAVNTEQ